MNNKNKIKKIKVIDFIKKLNEIGYDENTILEFDTVDGDTGEVYDIGVEAFISGDEYSVPNENVIDIELSISEEFIKAKSIVYLDEVAYELSCMLNKYRM